MPARSSLYPILVRRMISSAAATKSAALINVILNVFSASMIA
jgi:hypothetical protein